MFSKKLDQILTKKVEEYLNSVYPNTMYWKGVHDWQGMVKFRQEINMKKNKFGFNNRIQDCILKWGGINNFNSYELMKIGLIELKKGDLSYNQYSRISSMSKLFSFYDSKSYFILDARVALTINHFIKSQNTGDLFIPFNPIKSKGNKVKNVLINYYKSSSKYDNMGVAYLAYNDLILRIYKKLSIPNKLPKQPEIVEMVLFSMAEKIANDVF
jgi:hypothetical protein